MRTNSTIDMRMTRYSREVNNRTGRCILNTNMATFAARTDRATTIKTAMRGFMRNALPKLPNANSRTALVDPQVGQGRAVTE